jgi:Low psii accumulation1 / Rep27
MYGTKQDLMLWPQTPFRLAPLEYCQMYGTKHNLLLWAQAPFCLAHISECFTSTPLNYCQMYGTKQDRMLWLQAPFRLARIVIFGGLAAGAGLGLLVISARLFQAVRGQLLAGVEQFHI